MLFNSEMTQQPNIPSENAPGGHFHCAGLKSDFTELLANSNSKKIKYVTLIQDTEE